MKSEAAKWKWGKYLKRVEEQNREKCKPCLAAFETKERGKTFQLNNCRESRPPLHQHMGDPPLFFAVVGLTPDSNDVPLLLPLVVFDDDRVDVRICLDEPISMAE